MLELSLAQMQSAVIYTIGHNYKQAINDLLLTCFLQDIFPPHPSGPYPGVVLIGATSTPP